MEDDLEQAPMSQIWSTPRCIFEQPHVRTRQHFTSANRRFHVVGVNRRGYLIGRDEHDPRGLKNLQRNFSRTETVDLSPPSSWPPLLVLRLKLFVRLLVVHHGFWQLQLRNQHNVRRTRCWRERLLLKAPKTNRLRYFVLLHSFYDFSDQV